MTEGESLSNWLRLTLVSGIGGERQRKLLRAFGLPEAVFSAGRSALRSVIGDKAADLLLDTRNEALVACAIAWSQQLPGSTRNRSRASTRQTSPG